VSAWPIVKLSDVATLSSGGTPSKANAAFWDGDIPWVSPKDMKTACVTGAEDKITRAAVDKSAARIVGANSVLAVVRSGILAHTFPVATLAREVSFNQDIKAITPKNGSLLPTYLFWMLKGQEARILSIGVKKGATVHSLSNGFLEALPFPLPPLQEQRRITGLLDRAAEIRQRADAARTKARALIPALFLDMFGDPATNPRGWPIARLGSLLDQIDGGWSPVCGDGAPTLDQWGVLKLSAVKSTGFVGTDAKRLPETIEPRVDLEVREGDLLFTRKNTIDLVGTAAVADSRGRKRMLPDTIFRLVPRKPPCFVPRYVSTLINMHSFRPAIRQLASGSASSMPGISKGRLSTLEIPVPHLPVQTAFAAQAQRIEVTARALDAAVDKAETMAAALSAEVFT
jgi:type I restriction enzyme S subunit